jgi:hypothetical protein
MQGIQLSVATAGAKAPVVLAGGGTTEVVP